MSNSEDYKGYRGRSLEVLQNFNAMVWCEVYLETTDGTFDGIILPRSETADDQHIVLKLPSGYNIGIRADKVQNIKILGRKIAQYKIPEKEFTFYTKLTK